VADPDRDPVRVVAVLGYSSRGGKGLDAVCIRRLRHAEGLSHGARAVVLSGWARRGAEGEAELMRAAWNGPPVPLVVDPTARTTAENAVRVAAASVELGADEVVVVTSSWHRRRAAALVRAALRGTGIAVTTSSPSGTAPPRLLLRELACLVAVPYQLLRLRKRPVTP
jgi:uncharacterized SAM-binding protein YcdF (DUF218 family)